MQITVQYTAQIKAAIGVAQEQLRLDAPARVSQLLSELERRHPATWKGLVATPDSKLMPTVVVCVQDRQIPPGEDATLNDGDTVLFLSAISGG